MIGGYIAENLGFQEVFYITGGLLLITFITTALFVNESFTRQDRMVLSIKETWGTVPDKNLTFILFVTYFVMSLALYSVEPIITIYITQLSSTASHVALLAGMTFSASGLASIVAAPRLGRLSDRIGPQKVMLVALIVAGLIFIPQAFVTDPWQLMTLRFVLGLAIAGLIPSVNTLIKRITPDSLTGRVFGFNMSAGYLGVFGGSVLGGQVAAYLGIRSVFFITGALLLVNAVWVYFKVYKNVHIREYASYL
jgi:MFS family permease